MSAILGTIIGFVSSFVPPVLEHFKNKEVHKQKIQESELRINEDRLKHEQNVELVKLQKELDIKASELRINEMNVKADIEETTKLLEHDAMLAEKNQSAFVSGLSASVRPIITYTFFFMFLGIKGVMLWHGITTDVPLTTLINIVWNEETEMIFFTIISFWFGSRAISKLKGKK